MFFALHIKFGIGIHFFIAFQVVLSFFALILFIRSIKITYGALPAFFCALTLTISYDWISWNYYMFSDSTFFSFTLLWLTSLICYPKPNLKQLTIQLVLLLLCVFSRPIGLGYVMLFGIFIIQTPLLSNKWLKISILSFFLTLFLLLSYLVIDRIEDHSLYVSTTEGWIICGVPSDLAVQATIPENYGPIRAWIYLIVEEPISFIKLFFLRLLSFFSPYSYYYSASHNLLNALVMLGIYSGLFFRWKRKDLKRTNLDVAVTIFLTIYVLIIALQCDNWEGRFYAASIPFWLVLGIARVFRNEKIAK